MHLGQLRARGDRDDDLVGQAPAELLGDLVAERLGALGVERADVDVDERPAVLFAGDLAGELVDVVVVAVDRHEVLGVDRRVDDLGGLEVAGDEHDGLDAGPSACGGDGVGEVAGRRAGEHLAAELAGGAQGARDDAVLEGVGGVGAVVLDPEVLEAELGGEVVGLEQPRVAGLEVGAQLDVVGDGEQGLVAPDVGGPGFDLLAGDGREVVLDLQRTKTLVTRVVRAELSGGAALATDQLDGIAEGSVAEGGVDVDSATAAGELGLTGDPFIFPGLVRRDGLSTWSSWTGCWGVVGPCPCTPLDEWLQRTGASHDVSTRSECRDVRLERVGSALRRAKRVVGGG